MRKLLAQPFYDLVSGLEQLAVKGDPRKAMCVALVAMIATWFVYVPIHEMLHVLGCLATGGTVSELEIAPYYGGTLLAKWFPFVVSGGDYAGRLSGFDWKGSDLIYLATDIAPYLLTIFVGVPLLQACARRRRPFLFGMAIVIGLAPFYNIIGDYYEMGSIMVTRVATIVGGGGDEILFANLRSDDIFKLTGAVITAPESLELNSIGSIVLACFLIALSFLLGIALAVATLVIGDCFGRLVFGHQSPPPAEG